MIWLWIGSGLLMLLLFLLFWSACKLGAEADERMEREFQKWEEGHSQNADGFFHEEVMKDADGA